MSRRALILGAKSAIAQALARRLAAEGYDLVLAARHSPQLEPFAADLRLCTQREVRLWEFDALDGPQLAGLPARVHRECGPVSLGVLVFGYLGNQWQALDDSGELEKILHTNFTQAVLALSHLARYLERREEPGGLIAISSVAGDRGRQSNYFYGAAKGGLSLFLQGLRNRLASTPVHVLTVKPGFVDTPMTRGLEGLFLVASPEKVAHDIVRAYQRKKDILYTPWFWRYIMLIIRNIPERLFKRLKL
ncbi:MAG: SDR family oxidoreductase [Candidatus Latescibacteria bacterium]|nr:SDR family oxidoreductase [Candidatus Latescibacterota bacterium]